ncbi:Uncharacterised protein [Vibrio cholerae]|nr:Uncharacterised protein [Vibrio cholerae]
MFLIANEVKSHIRMVVHGKLNEISVRVVGLSRLIKQ